MKESEDCFAATQEEPVSAIVNMRQMRLKDRGVIKAVKAQGELGRRLRDMGLVPGAEISIVGRAPLKDPVALRLRGCTLTLRNNEADHISVELLPNDCPGHPCEQSDLAWVPCVEQEKEHPRRRCRAAQRPPSGQRTLSDLRDGEITTVRGLNLSRRRQASRLMALGFTPGAKVKMLSNTDDTLMVEIRSSRLCLCGSMAQGIFVEETPAPESVVSSK